eukprot:GGOE01057665.1.p2 GENE.GGOE01057665.1~~GGOE01057665.1.p2  ORF type:complete len:119 (-),score=2.61 GGOE01057665.1:29-385(-)
MQGQCTTVPAHSYNPIDPLTAVSVLASLGLPPTLLCPFSPESTPPRPTPPYGHAIRAHPLAQSGLPTLFCLEETPFGLGCGKAYEPCLHLCASPHPPSLCRPWPHVAHHAALLDVSLF